RRYRILSKGNANTIIQTLEPSVERGQNMLMRGRELWVYMPTVSQPVRLSLSQRLTGQVANGDLARANFAGDYTPKLLRTEPIDGHDHHVLELVAAERGITYPKVLYWVRADNGHPHKAEFYALSGRLLKTCRYEEFKPLGGKLRPTRLVMTDALKAGDESVLEYSDLTSRRLPNRMFTKDYMKRLE
ncbi:MAG: outer membrane lipoprotein-sorting protein, partial [Burkholderiaceae bacterium]